MYSISLTLHSWMRWVVLVTALIAVVRGLSGWNGSKRWSAADDRSTLLFIIALDIQVLIGLILYVGLSPITRVALADFGAAMRDPGLRFWAVEHVVGMMAAAALGHVGRVRIRRGVADGAKFRNAAIFIGCSLVLMLLSIPWPGMRLARPLLR